MSYIFSTAIILLVIVHGFYFWYLRKKFWDVHHRLNRLESLVWEASALNGMVSGQPLLPRPGGWAAATDILFELTRRVQVKRPSLIVELGSGLSTVILATAASRYSGHIISIDHDAVFAEQTKRELERRGLQDYVEIRVAPLTIQEINGETCQWYDVAVLSDLSDIDLLFIDGPPAAISNDIRKPAVPFFWSRLSSTGEVVLDDSARAGEQIAVSDWKNKFPEAKFTEIDVEKGGLIIEKNFTGL